MGFLRESMIHVLKNDGKDISTILKMIGLDGGKGSGNFGHSGRPGKRGGSAKRGVGGVSNETAKAIKQDRNNFKTLSREDKVDYLRKNGQIAYSYSDDNTMLSLYAARHGMSVDKYLDWRAARYFTMRKYQPEIDYKTPLKSKEVQGKYIPSDDKKDKYIKEHTGVSNEVAKKMRGSLKAHFGSSTADCEWTDKFIDSDSRYEGAIYRWKHYGGSKAKKVVSELVPGAKIGNKHESNWSFSSDPWTTSHFGDYDGHYYESESDEVTIRYTCDRNITGSPVQCLSGFSDGECEVIPHSKTTWTITSVEKVQMPKGGWMYDVHMVEDDWHEEQGIPVWKPTGNEIHGGWREDFPHDDFEADKIYEGIRAEAKKSGDHKEINEFMNACPVGTVFYKYGDEQFFVFRKCDKDYWEGADVTDKLNEHVNAWFESNGETNNENDWSYDDKSIWEKCEQEGLNKHITVTQARERLLDDNVMLTQVGGAKKVAQNKTKDDVDEDLKKMKDDGDYDDIPDYLDGLPTGFELYDKKNDFTLKKNEDGEWEYLDWGGEHVTDMTSNDVKGYFISKECDLGVKKDERKEKIDKEFLELKANGDIYEIRDYLSNLPNGTELNVPDKGYAIKKPDDGSMWWEIVGENSTESQTMIADHIKYDPTFVPELKSIGNEPKPENSGSVGNTPEKTIESFKEHNTKDGIKSKLEEFKNEGKTEECAKWLDDLPVGTVLGNDEMKVKYTYKGNGKWSADIIAVDGISSNSHAVAKVATAVGVDVKSLPVKVPKDIKQADTVLQEVKKNNREALADFVENAPPGITIMNPESGIVFKKDEYDGWEAIDTSVEKYSPQKPWSSYKDVWTFLPGSKSTIHNIGLEGTQVIGMD